MEKDTAAVLAHRLNNMPNLYDVTGGSIVKPIADAHNSVVEYLVELTDIVSTLFSEMQPYYNVIDRNK